ncbi:MAG: hypothetical protein EOP60_13390 [Sphingomonadales bacterium]|nr:MAG: hypothetical protein EOP60_13390 [Sphingomonadales bacterium]
MKLHAISASTLAIAALSACSGKAPDNASAPANTTATVATAPGCAPNSAKLPITGLCQEQAAALLLASPGTQPTAPDDCTWVVNEAKVLEGALLYRAAKCAEGTATLEFVPGARMASFDLAVSPYGKQSGADTIAQVIDGKDGKAIILAEARRLIEDPVERARCQVREAKMEDWPADALVVDEVPIPEADGIRSACGEFGLDEGAQTFWRVSQGSAWFFRLGQETPVVDAASFTLVNRDAAGNWVRS